MRFYYFAGKSEEYLTFHKYTNKEPKIKWWKLTGEMKNIYKKAD